MEKVFIISMLLFFSHFVFCTISQLTVKGVVVSYDKKSVILAQNNGSKVKVPKSSIPKEYKLKTGNRVHAILDSKKLIKLLKKQEESSEKHRIKPARSSLNHGSFPLPFGSVATPCPCPLATPRPTFWGSRTKPNGKAWCASGKGRSCVTGQYVKKSTVKQSPRTTVTHRPKKRGK